MKKLYFLSAVIIVIIVFAYPDQKVNFHDGFRKPSEAPGGRKAWDASRLVNPNTGKMPSNIRSKEMRFAQSLPNDFGNSSLNWIAEGPYNVGGRTRALAIDCTDENILLAGGASGGVWRSTDQGQSWEKMTQHFQLHNVTCIDQDTRVGKENIWYHGSGELTGSSAGGGGSYFDGNGIYKSTDGGITWDSIPITADNNAAGNFNPWDFIWNIALDPSNNIEDELYCATYGSIHRSVDGGQSWSQMLGGGNAYYNNVEVTSNGVVYATLSSDGTDKGIWRSEDGMSWNRIQPNSFPQTYGRAAIGINPSDENEIYFLIAETDGAGQYTNTFFNGETWTSLYKYTYLCGNGSDTCGVWEDLSANIPANRPTTFDNFNSQGGYDLLVKVKTDEPNVVFIGGTNLWRSTDGFSSDTNTTQIGGYYEGSYHGQGNWDIYYNHHPDQHDLLFLPSNPDVILSATDGGVYKSNDCKATPHVWERLNNGYQTTQLYSVSISKDPNNPVILGGFQDNGNFVNFSGNPLDEWTMPFNGDGTFSEIADNNEDFYIQIQRGVLYKMKLDNSGNILAFNRMDPADADTADFQFINQICMVPDNDDYLYFPEGNTIWRQDAANNFPYNNDHNRIMNGWTELQPSFSGTDTLQEITAIAATTFSHNKVYYGTNEGKLYRINNASFTNPPHSEITHSLFPNSGHVTNICIDPIDPNKLIVTFSNYNTNSVFYSEDGGSTWGNISGNLEEPNASGFYTGAGNGPSCRAAQILYINNSPIYFMATSTGLYATDSLVPYFTGFTPNLTTEWKQIGTEEIGNVVVENIKVRQDDGKLVVGTHGTGIYSTTITDITDIFPNSSDIANIEQNNFNIYPNPSNSLVHISWENMFDELVIFNSLGKKVSSIKITNQSNLQLSVEDLPKGIYYITLKSKKEEKTQKLIIN